jgi:hypothetical protein
MLFLTALLYFSIGGGNFGVLKNLKI